MESIVIRKFLIAGLSFSALFGCALFALSVNHKFGYSGSPVGLIVTRGNVTLTIRDSTARSAGKWGFTKLRSSGPFGQGSLHRSLWRLPSFRRLRSGVRIVTIPLWISPVVFGVYPVLVLIRGPMRRWRRRRRGLCEGCGYDIRASQDRCPECGAKISLA